MKRVYRYFVSSSGLLFLDDVLHKNFTSCLKDPVAIDFLLRLVRPNTSGIDTDLYPFLSPCGPELNLVRAEQPSTPIVFRDLNDLETVLKWGATIETPFQPHKLAFDQSGAFYHFVGHRKIEWGLLATPLAERLSERIDLEIDNMGRGVQGAFHDKFGTRHTMQRINFEKN